MKKISVLFLCFALLFSCNKEDQLRLEQMQKDYDALSGKSVDVDPASEAVVPQEETFAFSFDKARYGVDAGSSVVVGYSLSRAAKVEVSATEGWGATVSSSDGQTGEITVTAPDPASPCDIVVTATAQDGRQIATILPIIVREPYTDATRTDVAALAYYGFHNGIATDYHFQMLHDGGFNMITIESVDDWKKQLDLCQAHGVKGVLFVNGPAGDYYRDGTSTKLRDIVNVAKDHPALVAYQIFDEPSVANIPQIKYEKDAIEAMDPNHPVYVNLHPGHAANPVSLYGTETYAEYVERIVTECNLKFITFDQYPVYQGFIDRSWYMTLCNIRESALRHNIPFWAFTLCCREWGREDPTLENIRLQCNTNLAFGAQVNQFFVYRATSGTNFAPIMSDGTYTAAYEYCKAYNQEMHNRGYVFAGCNVKALRNTYVVENWLERLSLNDLPPQIKSLYTTREALISFIENKGNEYIAIVNSIWNMSQVVKVELEDMVYAIDHDGVFTELQPGLAEFQLEGGDMIVLKVK